VEDSPTGWWVTPYYFGIDQGPVALMIENHRSGLIWDVMRRCPYIIAGLRRAGFTGGWLNGHSFGGTSDDERHCAGNDPGLHE
jgi:hypothetical protein